ncbi:MAG: methyltransferase domain-containing protein [Burkholderiales bacterium]|nr:methyltransferase domain-containing protein [Burkholderiales bacterium]
MISQQSFDAVTAMFERVSGIQLGESKRALVTGRLQKLAQTRGLQDVDRYVQALLDENDPEELVRVVDKLTTNETYFFREPEHFDFLASLLEARPRGAGSFRVWSAASSSGEEAYSIAMVLADRLGAGGWEVVGTDLSTAMVDAARRALYPMERARHVPVAYLKRFCRKGHGEYEGQLLVARELRDRVHFTQANLMQPLPDLGSFDLIFLRNVLIYFDPASKEAIARRVLGLLKPGGHLFTGHAESLASTSLRLRTVKPAVYAHA